MDSRSCGTLCDLPLQRSALHPSGFFLRLMNVIKSGCERRKSWKNARKSGHERSKVWT